MSYVKALDVSQWQRTIDWVKVKKAGYQIAIIKMSGADAGLYFDTKAAANYANAKKAALAVGGYHFGYGLDPVQEADYFIKAMTPLAENDVMVLDCEAHLAARKDVVAWCQQFMERVHDKTGVWPLIYMSLSVLNSHNWSSVLKNCGLWLAAWNNNPAATLSTHVYVMHQYWDVASVPGIAGNVDVDAWFGTIAQFNKYGYHKPLPEPPVTPPKEKPSEPTQTNPKPPKQTPPKETKPPKETTPPAKPPIQEPEVPAGPPKENGTTKRTDSRTPDKSSGAPGQATPQETWLTKFFNLLLKLLSKLFKKG